MDVRFKGKDGGTRDFKKLLCEPENEFVPASHRAFGDLWGTRRKPWKEQHEIGTNPDHSLKENPGGTKGFEMETKWKTEDVNNEPVGRKEFPKKGTPGGG